MSTIDKAMVIIALILGVLDVVPFPGTFSRVSLAGVAIILLAIVLLHQGGVLNY